MNAMMQSATEHEERQGGLLPNGVMCTNEFDGRWCDRLAIICCSICARATCHKCIARWVDPNERARPETGPNSLPVCNACSWAQRFADVRNKVGKLLQNPGVALSTNPEDEPWVALSMAQDLRNDYDGSVWLSIFSEQHKELYHTYADLDMPFSAAVDRYCREYHADAADTLFRLDGRIICPSTYVGFLCLEDDVQLQAVSRAATGNAHVQRRSTCSCSVMSSVVTDDITLHVHVANGNKTVQVRCPPHASAQQLLKLFKKREIPCDHARLIALSKVLWLNSDGYICDLEVQNGGTVHLVDRLLNSNADDIPTLW